MKKTLLLALGLFGLLGAATIFYNNYQENDPSKLGPSGIYSELKEQESQDSANTSTTTETEDTTVIPALDFTVYDHKGNAITLSDFYGKPIVVNFWATWCGPCKSELPAFEQLYQEYGSDVSFLMVNLTDGAQETISGVSDFVTENGYQFPVYYDTEMNAAVTYSVYSIPATLFIDADGNIVASHMGAMSESTLRNYIENILITN